MTVYRIMMRLSLVRELPLNFAPDREEIRCGVYPRASAVRDIVFDFAVFNTKFTNILHDIHWGNE